MGTQMITINHIIPFQMLGGYTILYHQILGGCANLYRMPEGSATPQPLGNPDNHHTTT
jgi:hypothetical protein